MQTFSLFFSEHKAKKWTSDFINVCAYKGLQRRWRGGKVKIRSKSPRCAQQIRTLFHHSHELLFLPSKSSITFEWLVFTRCRCVDEYVAPHTTLNTLLLSTDKQSVCNGRQSLFYCLGGSKPANQHRRRSPLRRWRGSVLIREAWSLSLESTRVLKH